MGVTETGVVASFCTSLAGFWLGFKKEVTADVCKPPHIVRIPAAACPSCATCAICKVAPVCSQFPWELLLGCTGGALLLGALIGCCCGCFALSHFWAYRVSRAPAATVAPEPGSFEDWALTRPPKRTGALAALAITAGSLAVDGSSSSGSSR